MDSIREPGAGAAILDSVASGLLVCNPTTGEVETVNEAFCDATGYEKSTLRSGSLAEFVVGGVPRDDLQRGVVTGETDVSWDVELADSTPATLDGTVRTTGPSESVAVLTVDSLRSDAVTGCRGASDTAGTLYRAVVDAAPVPIWVQEGTEIVFANDATARIFGVDDPANLVGESSLQYVVEEQRESARELRRQVLDEQAPTSAREGRIRAADGTVRHVLFAAAPLDRGDAMVVIARDITDQKEYESVLERRTEQLELLNRIVRHDVRNDMQLVLAKGRMLAERLEGETADHAASLVENGEHVVELTRIVEELMEVMTADGGLDLESVRLVDVLTDQVGTVADAYDRASVEIVGDVPAVDVEANEMLASVFRNVVENAVQHNDTAAPTVRVHAERGTGDTVLVQVADDGPGVPDGQKEAVFGKGEKGLESDGVGLGLYLVNELMSLFDGEVWVEDREDPFDGESGDVRGAVFNLRFRTV